MCCPVAGNFLSCLSPYSGIAGMRVDHAPDLLKLAIEDEMGRHVGRRSEFAFHDLSIQIHHYDVDSFHCFVCNAARFNGNQPALTVDPAGVTPGEENQAAPYKFEICLEHRVPKGVERHSVLAFAAMRRSAGSTSPKAAAE